MASREALRAESKASRFITQREIGPWSEAEQRAFDQWLAESTLHRVTYYRLHAAWHEAGRLKALHVGTRRAAPLPVPAERELPRRSPVRWVALAAAAGVMLAVAGILGLSWGSLFSTDHYSTGIGGLEVVQLEDGSRVTINTNSQVRIRINAEERRVELSRGEAFFDVAKDPVRPFVVQVGEQRVVAVGTQFSVRREANEVRVSVTEGAVRMGPKAVLLPAGTMARADAGSVLVQERPISEIEQGLTWRDGTLTFNRTPLLEAVQEINRYNARQIVIRDETAASVQVGGTFVATKLDSFLRLLEGGFPVRVTEEGDRIVIDSK